MGSKAPLVPLSRAYRVASDWLLEISNKVSVWDGIAASLGTEWDVAIYVPICSLNTLLYLGS